MQQVIYEDLGRISYKEAWDYQTKIHEALKSNKLAFWKQNKQLPPSAEHRLLFCEHNPVFTLGKSGSEDHVLLRKAEMEEKGFEYFKINRGGDITYHGPGQIVGYPIFDLEFFFTDVHKYVRTMEEVVMQTLAEYGIETMRIKEYTGVWLPAKGFIPKRKICAIGVHLSRWVSLHGFALNVNTDLSHFNHIIPCGIQDKDKTVTSMAQELKEPVDVEIVKQRLKDKFAELFNFEFTK